MHTSRVVEVIHDRGEKTSPRWLLGSGFVIRKDIVLTAAHNLGSVSEVGPDGTTVRWMTNGSEHRVTHTLVRIEELDLAVLVVPGIDLPQVRFGRIDRSQINQIDKVMAVGFPNYKHVANKPAYNRRQPAQPCGNVPSVENFGEDIFVLKLTDGIPTEPALAAEASPWEGLSGAGVFVDDALVGIAIEHDKQDGLGVIRFQPVCGLQVDECHSLLYAALAVTDPETQFVLINRAPPSRPEISEQLRRDLLEIKELEDGGLLKESDAGTLRITAFERAKGWR